MAEIIKEVGEDVAKLMAEFTKYYIGALINSKLEEIMDQAVGAIIPDGLDDMLSGGGDDQGDIIDDDKDNDDDDNDVKPFASGVCVLSYKTGRGPDNVDHRYYDIACWSLKTSNSVILKQCRRHTELLSFQKSLKKSCKDISSIPFPAKKLTTKRTPQFYTTRMKAIHNFFEKASLNNNVTKSDDFLKYFGLVYDSDAAYLREIFFDALQTMCEDTNINWNYALRRAERLGLDLSQVEMLKIIAIEKLGKAATAKIRSMNTPAYVPGKLKHKFVGKFEGKLYGIIGTAVETGWSTTEVAFNKIAAGLNDVLNKAVDPIKNLLDTALAPLSEIITEKFDELQKAITISNDDLQDKNFNFINRFTPLKTAFSSIKSNNGSVSVSVSDILSNLLSSIDDMNNCSKYVSYIQYNLGDPDGLIKYIPFLSDLQNNHYRLTIALSDCAYILLRATVRAFIPIAKYLDKCLKNFDANSHSDSLVSAIKEGGRKLAIDYFSLPSTLRRSTWYCGRNTEKLILLLAQQTINKIADLIAQFGTNWKPTSSSDILSTFITALETPLNNFLNDRVSEWLNVVRRCMQDMIAAKFYSTVGNVIDSLCDKLDGLCSNLPPPLSDYLKPGQLIKYLLNKLVINVIVFGVKKLAQNTEKLIYSTNPTDDDNNITPMDQSLCRSLRWAPRIRNDDISFDAEPDDDDNDKNDDDNKDNDNDQPGGATTNVDDQKDD